MPLSCGCEGWAPEPGDIVHEDPGDYVTYARPRGKRCSCGDMVRKGDLCAIYERWTPPGGEIEERIYGEDGEKPLADAVLCERCADLYWSLKESGFKCVFAGENMLDLINEIKSLQVNKGS